MKFNLRSQTLIIALISALTLGFILFLTGYYFGSTRGYDYTYITTQSHYDTAPVQSPLPSDLDVIQLLININTATLEELCQLNGVGTALAMRIVDYRTANGNFVYKYELMNVKGIGEALYSKIADFITVD